MAQLEYSEGRECKIIAVAGMRGIGKTVETIRIIYNYVWGNPKTGTPPRKVLIFDVNNEFENFWFFNDDKTKFHSIKTIAIKDIPRFAAHPKIEVRRIRPWLDNGKKMSLDDMAATLEFILANYQSGLLLVEDINKYIGDYMPQDLIGTIVTSRHVGVDVIMHFQTIGRIGHPKIIGNCNYIRMHKTNDTVKRHENKFEEKTELFQLAEIIVGFKYKGDKMRGIEANPRYFLYINNDISKIEGDFNEEDMQKCIQLYITRNYRNKIKPLLDEKDFDTGNAVYNHKQAVQAVQSELRDTYFHI